MTALTHRRPPWTTALLGCIIFVATQLQPAGASAGQVLDAAAQCGDPSELYGNLPISLQQEVLHAIDHCTANADCCHEDELKGFMNGSYVEPSCLTEEGTSACTPGLYLRSEIIGNSTSQVVAACPAGYFCVSGLTCLLPCTSGAYCPEPPMVTPYKPEDHGVAPGCAVVGACCDGTNTTPVRYPHPTYEHQICAGNSFNEPCPAGWYCKSPTTRQLCDKGNFCRAGSISPHPCGSLSFCKAGTGAPVVNFLGPLLLLVVFVGSLVMIAMYEHRRRLLAKCAVLRRRPDHEADEALYIPLLNPALVNADTSSSATTNLEGESGILKRKPFTITIEFDNLGLTLKGSGSSILQGVSGTIKPFCVTAVMGPSGAGKTTFLSTLSGKAYYGNQSGVIRINGQEVSIRRYKRITGFVSDPCDILSRTLSCICTHTRIVCDSDTVDYCLLSVGAARGCYASSSAS